MGYGQKYEHSFYTKISLSLQKKKMEERKKKGSEKKAASGSVNLQIIIMATESFYQLHAQPSITCLKIQKRCVVRIDMLKNPREKPLLLPVKTINFS